MLPCTMGRCCCLCLCSGKPDEEGNVTSNIKDNELISFILSSGTAGSTLSKLLKSRAQNPESELIKKFIDSTTSAQRKAIHFVNLQNSQVSYLPDTMNQLVNVERIDLYGCVNLTTLPDSLGQLVNLKELHLEGCVGLTALPEWVLDTSTFHSEVLDLSWGRSLTALPESINKLHNLRELNLTGCKNLTTLPKSISQLVKLKTITLRGCTSFNTLPDMGKLVELEALNLEG